MNTLRTFERYLSRAVNGLLVTLFSVMLLLAVVQVGLRFFFKTGLLWGDVAARNLVLWVGFLGAVIAAGESKHFHIDLLSRFLPPRGKAWVQRMVALFAAVICFELGRASWAYLAMEADSRSFLDLPVPLVEAIIPAGFFLMMVQFALRTIIATPAQPPGAEDAREPLPR
jgi:TRAP-type C4-dicarboxylate transport system permease small subunit